MYSAKTGDLYDRVKVPIGDIDTLDKMGVLAIALTVDGVLCGQRFGTHPRQEVSGLYYGFDHYAFVRTAKDEWYIDGWDEVELFNFARSMADPMAETFKIPRAVRRAPGETTVAFHGFYLPRAEWIEAMDQFNLYMGSST